MYETKHGAPPSPAVSAAPPGPRPLIDKTLSLILLLRFIHSSALGGSGRTIAANRMSREAGMRRGYVSRITVYRSVRLRMIACRTGPMPPSTGLARRGSKLKPCTIPLSCGTSAKPHDAPKDLAPVLGWGALPSTSTHSQIPRSTCQVSEGTTSPLQTSPPRADANNDRIQRQEDLIGIPRRQLFKSRAAFHFDSYIRLPLGLFFLCRPSSSYLLHRLRSGLASAILPASRRMPDATLREFHSLSIVESTLCFAKLLGY